VRPPSSKQSEQKCDSSDRAPALQTQSLELEKKKEEKTEELRDGNIVHYIYTYENNVMKPTKHWKSGKEANGNTMQGVNLINLYYLCV
jgi:hypothetical protein